MPLMNFPVSVKAEKRGAGADEGMGMESVQALLGDDGRRDCPGMLDM